MANVSVDHLLDRFGNPSISIRNKRSKLYKFAPCLNRRRSKGLMTSAKQPALGVGMQPVTRTGTTSRRSLVATAVQTDKSDAGAASPTAPVLDYIPECTLLCTSITATTVDAALEEVKVCYMGSTSYPFICIKCAYLVRFIAPRILPE
jgi:hypothetical protein